MHKFSAFLPVLLLVGFSGARPLLTEPEQDSTHNRNPNQVQRLSRRDVASDPVSAVTCQVLGVSFVDPAGTIQSLTSGGVTPQALGVASTVGSLIEQLQRCLGGGSSSQLPNGRTNLANEPNPGQGDGSQPAPIDGGPNAPQAFAFQSFAGSPDPSSGNSGSGNSNASVPPPPTPQVQDPNASVSASPPPANNLPPPAPQGQDPNASVSASASPAPPANNPGAGTSGSNGNPGDAGNTRNNGNTGTSGNNGNSASSGNNASQAPASAPAAPDTTGNPSQSFSGPQTAQFQNFGSPNGSGDGNNNNPNSAIPNSSQRNASPPNGSGNQSLVSFVNPSLDGLSAPVSLSSLPFGGLGLAQQSSSCSGNNIDACGGASTR